jgi:hypothetical protein
MDAKAEYDLTFEMVFHYTIPLLTPKDGDIEAGSGVLVQIGGRVFIATAEHCMTEQAVIVDEKGFSFPPQSAVVTVLNRGADPTIDIGFLELKDDERLAEVCKGDPDVKSKSFCPLNQLSLAEVPMGGMLHIVGYPVESRIVDARTRTIELRKRGFGTQFQEQEDGYLLFPFPKKEKWFHQVGVTDFEPSMFIDKPKGFSGGGLWAFQKAPEGSLFSPLEHIKLMGIQCARFKERRIVKCVPIRRWLELVHNSYPDLRAEIEATFPGFNGVRQNKL